MHVSIDIKNLLVIVVTECHLVLNLGRISFVGVSCLHGEILYDAGILFAVNNPIFTPHEKKDLVVPCEHGVQCTHGCYAFWMRLQNWP